MEYSNDVEHSNIKEYETNKEMWILWQGIRVTERYVEVLLQGMSVDKIPTKREYGRTYYSKKHLEELRRTD